MNDISTWKSSPRSRRSSILPAMILWVAVASGAAAEPVKFTFNPPVPLTWEETLKTTRTDEGPDGTSRELVLISRSSVELVSSGDGYAMTIRPESVRQLRNGREVRLPGNPIEDLVQQGVFTYTLDSRGALVSVEGHEEIMQRLQNLVIGLMQQVPEERRPQFAAVAHAVTQQLKPEAILARLQAEWGARVPDFDGAELEVGETIVSESDFTLPNQETVRFFNVVRLEEMVDGEAARFARLTYQYDTDASALKNFAGEALQALGVESPTSAEVRGGGERLIDPATLLIQSETQRRVISMEVPGPDGVPVRGSRTEIREYTYEYTPAPAAD